MTNFLPRAILNTILTALAAVSAVLLVTTAFDISVSIPLLGLSTLLFSGLICCCFLKKKLLLFVGPAIILLAAAGFFLGFFDTLVPTTQQFLNKIFTHYATAYPSYSIPVPEAPDPSITISYTLLFSVVAWVLSIWMAWGVGFRSSIITIAGSLPLLLICLLVNDTPPSAVPLTFLLSVWATLLMTSIRPEDHPGIEVSRIALVFLASLLLVGTVALFYPKENLDKDHLPEFIQEILEKLPGPVQEVLSPDAETVKDENLGADVSEILDLTTQGPRDRQDTVMMQLSATESGVLYLRAAAKDVYTGSTWESMDMAESADSVYAHTSIGTSFGGNNQAAVQIRNYKDAAQVVFAPYGYINCNNAEDITSDLRISMLEDDYIIYYWPGVRTMDLSIKGITRPGYDSYVSDVCLSLPAETQEALYEMAIACGYDPEMDTLQTVAWVAEFIRSSGTYELNVDYQPADQDFALYFLNYSRQGYCVHYATAAAAMYRALGIPSRYASGYRVNVPAAGEVTDVTDQDTHAWAEVYLSGIGWIPIETTPGFGESTVLPQVEQEVEQPPEPSAEPEAPEGASEPTPTPTPTPTPEPEDPLTQAAEQAGEGVKQAMDWFIPLVLILLLLFLILRRIFLSARRKRRFQKSGSNQAVLYMYHHLEKVCRYGIEMPEDLEAIALKAKFSQHEITDHERSNMYHGVRNLTRSTEKTLRFFRKLRFRWISCLHMK